VERYAGIRGSRDLGQDVTDSDAAVQGKDAVFGYHDILRTEIIKGEDVLDHLLIVVIEDSSLMEMIQDLTQRVQLQAEEMGRLKDEIAALKKQNKCPKIKSSKMDDNTGEGDNGNPGSRRSGASKRKSKKTQDLEIHHREVVKAEGVQQDWSFKGHESYVVQDLRIEPQNTCYLLEQWEQPDGTYEIAKAPQGGHYSTTLVSYILHQYYHQHVSHRVFCIYHSRKMFPDPL